MARGVGLGLSSSLLVATGLIAALGGSGATERAVFVLGAAVLCVDLPGAYGIAALRFDPFCLD